MFSLKQLKFVGKSHSYWPDSFQICGHKSQTSCVCRASLMNSVPQFSRSPFTPLSSQDPNTSPTLLCQDDSQIFIKQRDTKKLIFFLHYPYLTLPPFLLKKASSLLPNPLLNMPWIPTCLTISKFLLLQFFSIFTALLIYFFMLAPFQQNTSTP